MTEDLIKLMAELLDLMEVILMEEVRSMLINSLRFCLLLYKCSDV